MNEAPRASAETSCYYLCLWSVSILPLTMIDSGRTMGVAGGNFYSEAVKGSSAAVFVRQ